MQFGNFKIQDWSLSVDNNENYLFRNVFVSEVTHCNNDLGHYVAICVEKFNSEYCRVTFQKPLHQLTKLFPYTKHKNLVKGSLPEVKKIVDHFLIRMNKLLVFI